MGGCIPGQNPREWSGTDLTVLNPERVLQYCINDRCENPVRPPRQRTENGHWQYYKNCSVCNQNKRYGLTGPERDDIVAAQNNKCAICKDELAGWGFGASAKSSAVDHCHKTGKTRGILCYHCNMALGQFKDSITVLESAIEYLRKHNEPN